jgi:predicted DNA binding protein
MIIAEYTLNHPVLRQALKRVPDLEIEWENSYASSEGQIQMIVWVESGDYEAFDTAVDEDPTVDDPVVLTETIDRRLYRFDLVETGATTSIMPVLTEVGGVQRSITATSEGWLNRTQFPSREAFERVYQFCRDNEIGFKFNRIYERSEGLGPSTPALTDAQIETLIEAVDSGYLDIPRKSSLAELGQRLEISESAASERFRRGVKNLIQETVSE